MPFNPRRGGLRIVSEHSPALQGKPVMEIAPVLAAIGNVAKEGVKRTGLAIGNTAMATGATALAGLAGAGKVIGAGVKNAVSPSPPTQNQLSTPPAPPSNFSWTR